MEKRGYVRRAYGFDVITLLPSLFPTNSVIMRYRCMGKAQTIKVVSGRVKQTIVTQDPLS